ncbi:MAG TPA: cellulase family glycosylhydrolase [Gemmataceae bacterium]|nr:cellulase family glycosylhydrolase [Gemmataceae bacterium]
MRTVMIGLILALPLTWTLPTSAQPPGPPPLKVVGKELQTTEGKTVRLRGVNIPSLEWGQGEHLLQSLAVATRWGANFIRLPLSQDRWFGKTPERQDGGVHYRRTVHEFVRQSAAKRCYVILDLHWSDAGQWGHNIGQHRMPDDHSVAFWNDLAHAFANQPAVLFGLYNEPYGVSWQVWRNGGQVMEPNRKASEGRLVYHTPGLQKLLDVCRAAGAKNVVVAGGLDWGYDLSGVAKGFALADPNGHGVVYDTHIYPWKKDWDRWVTPATKDYPVLIGEFGPNRGDPKVFLSQVLAYIDRHQLHWAAWCMHPGATPNMLKDWRYTLTAFGEVVKSALGGG